MNPDKPKFAPLDRPEDGNIHMRPPGVLSALRYLGGLLENSSRLSPTHVREQLAVILNDHLRLEGEVIRLAGIVRRENESRRDRWPFDLGKQLSQTDSEKVTAKAAPLWNDLIRTKFYECKRCHKVYEYKRDSAYSDIVSVNDEPWCRDCLSKAQSKDKN